MVFINYHRVYRGAVCSDPLKELYRKAELTSCALGSVSAQPIKNTIIHFQDHFALIEHVCYIQFFSTPLRTPAYLYDSRAGGGRNSCCLSQREEITVSKLRLQINDLTKQRKSKKYGNGVNWILWRLTVYDLNQLGILSTVEEVRVS